MIDLFERERVLKKALAKARRHYHFIVIDCPPSLGLLTLNALTAADSVLIPVQTEYFALEGLGQLLNTIKIVRQHLNPDLEIEGVLLTMVDGRLRLSNQVAAEVRRYFGDRVFESVVVRNVRVSEAPSFGKPVLLYDAVSAGTRNYMALAGEVLRNNQRYLVPEATPSPRPSPPPRSRRPRRCVPRLARRSRRPRRRASRSARRPPSPRPAARRPRAATARAPPAASSSPPARRPPATPPAPTPPVPTPRATMRLADDVSGDGATDGGGPPPRATSRATPRTAAPRRRGRLPSLTPLAPTPWQRPNPPSAKASRPCSPRRPPRSRATTRRARARASTTSRSAAASPGASPSSRSRPSAPTRTSRARTSTRPRSTSSRRRSASSASSSR